MLYDIHTHHRSKHNENVTSILNLNVADYIYCCGLDLQSTDYSLGIHPWKIRSEELSKNIDFIEKNGTFNCVKTIGECGLDKLCETPWELQKKAFLAQILIGEKLNKPLVIHCVKAYDELILLKKEINPQQIWIIHGFRGKPQLMEQLVKQGFFLSFGDKFNEETLRNTPSGKYFLETDDSGVSIQSVYEKVAATLSVNTNDLISQIESTVNTHLPF